MSSIPAEKSQATSEITIRLWMQKEARQVGGELLQTERQLCARCCLHLLSVANNKLLPNSQLNPIYFSVSEGQQAKRDFAGCLWLSVSHRLQLMSAVIARLHQGKTGFQVHY